ncbi:MAG: dicarboxylate/amino acid:cation symporter [Gemmatimonadota bacterium]|nr:dicarboxylate/amino acid:cation symporter [Gemmatimonadota bacterium]MDH3366602.1 dicarboxylate/amino acid:cation symporter [Gemmatimonadota bacterium]MDH3476872.1 dicarboxylate/amino acid:cation symporter [Gemmatimonadota bacterium]MDH5548496.1 dicarboxylate/amino acid:cation symporter [Gemmatimonadota bacterium]
MKLQLHWQILIAMVLGVAVGVVFQVIYDGEPSGWLFALIASLGTIFINLLRMVIVPLIVSSIVSGVASVGDGKSIGRLGLKTFSYYFVSSLLAILIGIFVTNLIKPGVGANIPVGESFDPSTVVTPRSPGQILIDMIPLNPIEAMSSGHMLGIIFFSIFLGFAITRTAERNRETLRQFFDALFDAMMKITNVVISVAPFGVFGLIVATVASAGVSLFITLSLYIGTILTGFLIHLLIVLPLLFYVTTRINPIYHFRAMSAAMVTAFSTCSSNATLPVTMSDVENKAGVSNTISSFVLPMGATVNMNGTALYECAGVIFISQVLGMQLDFSQQFLIVLTALLSAVGAAGIPAAGVVVIFIVTQAIGFTDAQVGLIIGTMLAVDRPIDMFRTTINIFSDSVGAVIVAKSEGETNFYPGMRRAEEPQAA